MKAPLLLGPCPWCALTEWPSGATLLTASGIKAQVTRVHDDEYLGSRSKLNFLGHSYGQLTTDIEVAHDPLDLDTDLVAIAREHIADLGKCIEVQDITITHVIYRCGTCDLDVTIARNELEALARRKRGV